MRKQQHKLLLYSIYSILLISGIPLKGSADIESGFEGTWVINEKLSDDTDRRVEKAIKTAGGKINRSGKKGKGRYKGGPKEQELYDHVSYDEILHFSYTESEFQLVYAEEFERIFYSDGRGRTVSARGALSDYSFAYWEGKKLIVESRPRDGGQIEEIFSLQLEGAQLKAELQLKPSSFQTPITIVRIYDRVAVRGKR